MLEADLVEAIIALPTDMFYNTGIATYIWILSNKQSAERQGKVQLINAGELYIPMRKSLGSKRKMISQEQLERITRCFGDFKELDELLDVPEKGQNSSRGRKKANPTKDKPKKFSCKIFATTDFGYRRITVERPLRLSAQFSDERISELQYAPKPLNAAMKWLDEKYSPTDGNFTEEQITAIRAVFKKDFKELKEKQIKELLAPAIWLFQQKLFAKALKLQTIIGTAPINDYQAYETAYKKALKASAIKLDNREKKQLENAILWENPEAAPVIKKIHKVTKSQTKTANPLYGLFEINGQLVEYKPSGNLRDNENIPLDPTRSTTELIESYFKREVAPHVPDAWIDASKRDAKDGEIGIVGYEIPFNRHFYQYIPPRPLEVIDAELDKVTKEIMALLQEVHS